MTGILQGLSYEHTQSINQQVATLTSYSTVPGSYTKLSLVANEAERILKLLPLLPRIGGNRNFTVNRCARSTGKLPAPIVLQEARCLLDVSKDPFSYLRALIGQSNDKDLQCQTKIRTIHHSFLRVTETCLECLEYETDDATRSSLLETSVSLSLRARLLGLPLHLPLSRALMAELAKFAPELIRIIHHQVAIEPDLCRTAVLSMLEHGHYYQANAVLQHSPAPLDRASVQDIYQVVFCITKTVYEKEGRKPWMSLMTSIVEKLAASIETLEESRTDGGSDLHSNSFNVDDANEEKDIVKAIEVLAASMEENTNIDNDFDTDDHHNTNEFESADETDDDYDSDTEYTSDDEDCDDDNDDLLDGFVEYLLLKNVDRPQSVAFFSALSKSHHEGRAIASSRGKYVVEEDDDDVEVTQVGSQWAHRWNLPDVTSMLKEAIGSEELALTDVYDDYLELREQEEEDFKSELW